MPKMNKTSYSITANYFLGHINLYMYERYTFSNLRPDGSFVCETEEKAKRWLNVSRHAGDLPP